VTHNSEPQTQDVASTAGPPSWFRGIFFRDRYPEAAVRFPVKGVGRVTDEPPTVPPPDKRLEIAYEAARNSLCMQDTTLGNLRTRASTLLAAAALFTSFSAGIGLINTDPAKGHVFSPIKGVILLGAVIAVSFFVLRVLWSIDDWCFGPSAKEIIDQIYPKPRKDGTTPSAKDVDQIRLDVIHTLIEGHGTNYTALLKKHSAFRAAASSLIAEVVLLVVMLWFWK
jgi:hypothetical protein